MHDNTKTDASVATDLDSGSRMPPIASTLTTTVPTPQSTIPSFQHSVSLPSPPCSPKQTPLSGVTASPLVSLSLPSTTTSMLQASHPATGKLDISLLLKSSPSPPSSSGAEAPRSYNSRASSVPPATTQHFDPAPSQHRPSVSSSAASSTPHHTPHHSIGSQSQIDPRVLSQAQAQAQVQSHAQSQAHRPVLPPLSTSTLQPSAPGPPSQPSSHVSASSPQQLLPSPLRPPKRPPPSSPHPAASPAKRQSKWTPEEDALIIELRGSGMKWEEISKRLPGRSAISCRLHYQNYLERRSEWDEERKNRLARLYERLKPDMWGPLAAELGIPWRAAEAMHWQLGEADMARRAGVVPFSLATSTSTSSGPSSSTATPAQVTSITQVPGGRYMSRPEDSPHSASVMAYGVRHGDSIGRLGRSSSFGAARMDDVVLSSLAQSGPGIAPMAGQGPNPGQALLPSLAELERGITAYDDRGRPGDAPRSLQSGRNVQGRYPPGSEPSRHS